MKVFVCKTCGCTLEISKDKKRVFCPDCKDSVRKNKLSQSQIIDRKVSASYEHIDRIFVQKEVDAQ